MSQGEERGRVQPSRRGGGALATFQLCGGTGATFFLPLGAGHARAFSLPQQHQHLVPAGQAAQLIRVNRSHICEGKLFPVNPPFHWSLLVPAVVGHRASICVPIGNPSLLPGKQGFFFFFFSSTIYYSHKPFCCHLLLSFFNGDRGDLGLTRAARMQHGGFCKSIKFWGVTGVWGQCLRVAAFVHCCHCPVLPDS